MSVIFIQVAFRSILADFLYILEFFKIFFVTGKFSYGLVDVALLTFLQTFANKIGPKWNHFETFINLIKILPRNVLPLLKYNYLKSLKIFYKDSMILLP